MAESPVVVVSISRNVPGVPERYRRVGEAALARVENELTKRGMTVRVVNAAGAEHAADPIASATEMMRNADAVMVLGGADITPAAYGQEAQVDNLDFMNRAADDFEITLVREAVAKQAPVFGICRGLQVVNVAHGGTLIQDLGLGLHRSDVPDTAYTSHDVTVVAGSKLAAVMAVTDEPFSTRTSHHQAADRVGDGLTVVARAADGVVEALESTEPHGSWVMAVQWHPEEAEADPIALGKLMDGFVAAIAPTRQQD